MEVTWEVNDGYVGKSRPHYTEVPDDELDECKTKEEKQELINEYVQGEFSDYVSWSII